MDVIEVETPHGPARAHLQPVARPVAALVLGHGAGGGVQAADLVAVAEVAQSLGVSVALVEQPYRVAGRRSPAPAKQLDAAWLAVLEQLRVGPLRELTLLGGGRSSGARVACRTARAADLAAVLCLAFPLLPPRRGRAPAQSRLAELEAVSVPMLVVQGERDPFGMPPAGPSREVARVPGDHALRPSAAVQAAVAAWLGSLLPRLPRAVDPAP
ncbi:MAG: alpha/beta family hydrolase [Solirubrobacteraceae bacterium]